MFDMLPRNLLCIVAASCVAYAGAELALSSNFADGSEIPADHRHDVDNISPPLRWSGAHPKTESFVLIVDSEREGKGGKRVQRTHWSVYDIPKDVTELREELSGAGASDVQRLGFKPDSHQDTVVVDPMGGFDGHVDPEIEQMQSMINFAMDASLEADNRAKEGTTSFGTTYYRGPSKSGSSVTFKLYALSERLGGELRWGASKEEIQAALKGKVLEKATLTGMVR